MEENKNIMAIKASKTLATRTSQSGKARVVLIVEFQQMEKNKSYLSILNLSIMKKKSKSILNWKWLASMLMKPLLVQRLIKEKILKDYSNAAIDYSLK